MIKWVPELAARCGLWRRGGQTAAGGTLSYITCVEDFDKADKIIFPGGCQPGYYWGPTRVLLGCSWGAAGVLLGCC